MIDTVVFRTISTNLLVSFSAVVLKVNGVGGEVGGGEGDGFGSVEFVVELLLVGENNGGVGDIEGDDVFLDGEKVGDTVGVSLRASECKTADGIMFRDILGRDCFL
jgi:hypothetical protein